MKYIKHKCIDCCHCNAERLICTPESEDAEPEYRLEQADLYTAERCDFFSEKQGGNND